MHPIHLAEVTVVSVTPKQPAPVISTIARYDKTSEGFRRIHCFPDETDLPTCVTTADSRQVSLNLLSDLGKHVLGQKSDAVLFVAGTAVASPFLAESLVQEVPLFQDWFQLDSNTPFGYLLYKAWLYLKQAGCAAVVLLELSETVTLGVLQVNQPEGLEIEEAHFQFQTIRPNWQASSIPGLETWPQFEGLCCVNTSLSQIDAMEQVLARQIETFDEDALATCLKSCFSQGGRHIVYIGLSHHAALVLNLRAPQIIHLDAQRVSIQQEALYTLQYLQPENLAYHIPIAFRLPKALSVQALDRALAACMKRHALLGMHFQLAGDRLLLQTGPHGSPSLLVIDSKLCEVARLHRRFFEMPFDLNKGPLFRAVIIRHEAGHHLLWIAHHTIFDGVSSMCLMADLEKAYEAMLFQRKPNWHTLNASYEDYCLLQHAYVDSPQGQADLNWWVNQLQDMPSHLQFAAEPSAAYRPACGTHILEQRLEKQMIDRLDRLARQHRLSLFNIFMGLYQVVLHRFLRSDRLVVVTPWSARPGVAYESLVGYFINMLPLPCRIDRTVRLLDLLKTLREQFLDALERGFVPYATILASLANASPGASVHRFGQSFVYQNWARNRGAFRSKPEGALAAKVEDIVHEMGGYPLNLEIFALDEGHRIYWKYDPCLVEAPLLKTLAEHWLGLVTALPELIESPFDALFESKPLWSAWQDFSTPAPIISQIMAQESASLAILGQDQALGYEDLKQASLQLALQLRRHGVGPEQAVAIYALRQPQDICHMLAVMLAGGFFVPLTPDLPKDRLHAILKDCGARLVLGAPPSLKLPLGVAAFTETGGADVDLAYEAIIESQQAAYMVYTSGSSGQPKGVLVSHGSLSRFVHATKQWLRPTSADRMLQFSHLGFDAAVEEIWPILSCGGQLVLRNDQTLGGAAWFWPQLEEWQISVIDLPTSFWHALVREGLPQQLPPTLRLVILGGEVLEPRYLKLWLQQFPELQIVNTYGPTEAPVVASLWACEPTWLAQHAGPLPIGQPLDGVSLEIYDPSLIPVIAGMKGELAIAGPGLARGYWHDPRQTAQKFVPDPQSKIEGGRMYLTGDQAALVQGLKEPELVFHGRSDRQLKVLGYRVEPDDIALQLKRHPSVREALVDVRMLEERRELVAWVIARRGRKPMATVLRQFLVERLPHYMVPAVFIPIDAWPLTVRGKIDRAALPFHEISGLLQPSPATPRDPEEQLIFDIWCDVLGKQPPSLHANFFELGGHSLTATRMVTRIQQVFKRPFPLYHVFEHPSIAAMARVLRESRLRDVERPLLDISRVDRDGDLPLSPAQKRLWLLQGMGAETGYIISVALAMDGLLQVNHFEKALIYLLHRHESLRTSFAEVAGEVGVRICPAVPFEIDLIDDPTITASSLQDYAKQSASRAFDLKLAPLLRVYLLRQSKSKAWVLINIHHLIADAWSLDILMDEWARVYANLCQGVEPDLQKLPIQYLDYSVRQHALIDSPAVAAQKFWWCERLRDMPDMLALPYDHNRPKQPTFNGALHCQVLDDAIVQDLRNLAAAQGVTLYTLTLAVYKLLLASYANSREVVLGTPIAHRDHIALESVIGFFVNSLVLRSPIDSGQRRSFNTYVQDIHRTCLQAFAHPDVPFEALVEALCSDRAYASNPLFQVTFQFLHMPPKRAVEGVVFEGVELDYGISRFDLSLHIGYRDQELYTQWEYATALFKPKTIQQMAGHYQRLLRAVLDDPDQDIAGIAFLDEAEKQALLIEWNSRCAAFLAVNLFDGFAKHATKHPNRTAILCGADYLTFGQLHEKALQLARHLQSVGVSEGEVVAVAMRSNLHLVVAVLAIVRLGAAYLPLDPLEAPERMTYMLKRASVRVLISNQLVAVKHLEHVINPEDLEELPASSLPQLAWNGCRRVYINYTSGSSGKPKGVVIQQNNILRLVYDNDYLLIDQDDRIAQAANPAFDAFTFEVWTALLHGVAMVMIDKQTYVDPNSLKQALFEMGVTVMFMTTAVFHQCVAMQPDMFAGLRYLLFGGEVLDLSAIKKLMSHRRPGKLLHVYGPTESTTFASWYAVNPNDINQQHIPIGVPIANTTLYVLDHHLRPLPLGSRGEIMIGGLGLAEGYLGQAAQTACAFVPDPFSNKPGSRLYRSGDLGWHDRESKALVFWGRRDKQVKIRGYRIEPAEVESVLKTCPGVADAIVLPYLDSDRQRRLAAWVVADGVGIGELPSYLGDYLPEFMIPSAFVRLDQLPLNANGKIARDKLPDPSIYNELVKTALIVPENEIEAVIYEIWSELLKLEAFCVTESFFKLGAHSLLMARASTRIWERLGVQLPMDILFEHACVRDLATYIDIARWSKGDAANHELGEFEEEGRI